LGILITKALKIFILLRQMDVRRLPGYNPTRLQMDEWMVPVQVQPQQQPTVQQTQPNQQTDCHCSGCKIYPKHLNYLAAMNIALIIVVVSLVKQKK
jgi:hypothetical protein